MRAMFPELSDDALTVLYILLQSKLFSNGSQSGIQDREIKAMTAKKIPRRKFDAIMALLEEKAIIESVSKRPRQHVVQDRLIR